MENLIRCVFAFISVRHRTEITLWKPGRNRRGKKVERARVTKSPCAMIIPKAQIIEMRYFGGLSVEETAAVLKVSDRTVLRDWETARVWLYRQLQRSPSEIVSQESQNEI